MARTTRAAARYLILVLIALSLAASAQARTLDEEQFEGRAPTAEELKPSVEAAFAQESYSPGAMTRLSFSTPRRGVTVQFFRVGPRVHADGRQRRVAWRCRWVASSRSARASRESRTRSASASGRAASTSRGSARSGRPRRLRTVHRSSAPSRVPRVAVVLPTMTWQAYNLRDDDGDGKGDSWYAHWTHLTVRLERPFLNRGVPFNFRRYDLPFLHWLAWNGHGVDFLSDADLERTSGAALADAYRLVDLPGHHEYVTTREYDAVERYRDLGGHLMFLSANNFFWRVVKHGDVIEKTQQWRDLGRPEAALIGVQYRGNDRGTHRAPGSCATPRQPRGCSPERAFADGMPFGSAGIEIDKTAARLTEGRACGCGHQESLRLRIHCADDVLRDRARGEGLRSRCVHARRQRAPADRRPPAREPVAAPRRPRRRLT